MAELLPTFNSSPCMMHNAAWQDEDRTIEQLRSMEMGEDSWSDAGVPELVRYLYGAKGLNSPTKWQCCFPSEHFS